MSATLSCESVRDLLPERLGGDLDELRARGVETHLAGCAACRAEEAELAGILGALESDAIPDPGERYWDRFAGRVRTRIAAEGLAQAPRRWHFAPALALAASLALIVFAAVRAPIFHAPEEEDPLLASYLPVNPATMADAVSDLSSDEADRFEARLLAKRPAPVATPAPAAKSSPAKAAATPAPASKGDPLDGGLSPRGLQDDLSGLDDLSPEELDRLLERLDAMKT